MADAAPEGARDLQLRVLMPTAVLVDTTVTRVVAEADDGAFCLLPRHIDFAAALVPGILTFTTAEGDERFAAIDRGILVKCDRDIAVSTLNGVTGDRLEELQDLVAECFLQLDEHERRTRTALARLEAGTLRAFREMQGVPGG
jgi:F-type H+-transporting ATPase subunit epsilon